MAIFPKAIYTFNAMLIKIPAKFFTVKEQYSTSYAKAKKKKNRIVKTILYNKGTSGEITASVCKLYSTTEL